MNTPQIIDHPSPNFDERHAGKNLDMLILHYTGMRTAEESLARLCDPRAKVSAHYLIDEDGTLYRLVDETKRAWHAGVSHWANETDINSCSLGIELQNPGHEFGYRDFPDAQVRALTTLCTDILSRHAVLAERILGHSDVAPSRKEDPGELFDWRGLAAAGIGADIVGNPVERLSGGQKARLLMALATIDAPHILILDEPTNHLDIESREALVHALNDFPGAVILISHDPHLVETVADQLWLVRGGRVAPFDGDLGDYRRLLLSERGGKTKGQKGGKKAGKAAELPAKTAPAPEQPSARETGRKPSDKAGGQLRAEVRAHERRVAELGAERSEAEAALADPALYDQNDAARIEHLTRKLGQIKAELAREEESWLAAQERLEGAV